MTTNEVWVLLLGGAGTLFMFISAVGILRLPDVHTRMHAVGKAATLGVSCLLLAAGLFFRGGQIWRMAALILLFLVTAPIATAAMARAAYYTDKRASRRMQYDDMADPRYQSEYRAIHGDEES